MIMTEGIITITWVSSMMVRDQWYNEFSIILIANANIKHEYQLPYRRKYNGSLD